MRSAAQHGMAERNAGTPIDDRLEFRVGINLSDVIVEGDDIYGDGVNVAARVEALPMPAACSSRIPFMTTCAIGCLSSSRILASSRSRT